MRNLATERCLRVISVAMVLITRVLHAQVTSHTSGYLRDSSRAIVPSGGDANSEQGLTRTTHSGPHRLLRTPGDTSIDLSDSGGFAGFPKADPITLLKRGPRGFEREKRCRTSKSGGGQSLSRLLSS